MINRLEGKSDAELLDITVDLVKDYRIIVENTLGSTPEEVRETQEALEGLSPAQIRDAVKLYGSGTPDKIREIPESLHGITHEEIMYTVRLYRYGKPAVIEVLVKLLGEFTPRQITDALRQYRKKIR